jgi:uncharacterized protein YkwD
MMPPKTLGKIMRRTILLVIIIFGGILEPVPGSSIEIVTLSSPFEESLLSDINRYRANHGLQPLLFDPGLYELAQEHSSYMHEREKLSHDHFDTRFRRSGSQFCLENVGWNAPTPKAQLDAWKSSSQHNLNMLHKRTRRAGISKVGDTVTFFACD